MTDYTLGRTLIPLKRPYRARDRAFAAARLDDLTIQEGDFRHCTFVNISFKAAVIKSSSFVDCIFVGCYFRRAELAGSSFVGCRFVDCNFSHVAIKSTSFNYCTFRACQLPFDELAHSLPREPNIREALARNLYVESSRLGLASDARKYRMAEIRAREDHLAQAIYSRSTWYQEHFDTVGRVRAAAQLASSLVNRWLWGYGERAWILTRNAILLAVAVFPAAYLALSAGFVKADGGPVNAVDALVFSLVTMIPGGIDREIQPVDSVPRALAIIQSLVGLIMIALFASHIFRWSLHR